MTQPTVGTSDRIVFLDNLRYFFVLCVVMQHACNAYRGSKWWPVTDGIASLTVQMLSAFFDSCTMPLLFFVSGYFALPGIQKKGASAFLKGKFRRLGIPWLVCIITICPILPLVYHYTRNGFTLTQSYWNLWLELMKNALRFDVTLVMSMKTLMANNGFYQRYMWFLSLLILFFVIFAAVYQLIKTWFSADSKGIPDTRAGRWAPFKLFLIVGFSTTVLSFAAIGTMMFLSGQTSEPEPLFTLGNIIQFRPSRLFFYVVYFGLGILTYRNSWIGRRLFPQNIKIWAVVFGGILASFLATRYLMMYGPEDFEAAFGMISFLFLNFLTVSTLFLCIALSLKYWNRPTAFDRNMASYSYEFYLSHYIFVIGFQLILLTVPSIPGLLKFGIVSVIAVVFSYLASRFLIKPFPRFTIAVVFGLFLLMVLTIKP